MLKANANSDAEHKTIRFQFHNSDGKQTEVRAFELDSGEIVFADTIRIRSAKDRESFIARISGDWESREISSLSLRLLHEYEALLEDQAASEESISSSAASQIVELVSRNTEFWSSEDGSKQYATIEIKDRNGNSGRANVRLRSSKFESIACSRFYEVTGRVPNSSALSDAQSVMIGKATWEGERFPTYIRIAFLDDRFFIDRGTPEWDCIEVNEHGWSMIQNPPVKFIRPNGLKPLCEPSPSGDIRPFFDLFKITESNQMLLASWLLMCLNPHGDFPILCLTGEQGSAKSTLAKALRDIVDPVVAPIRDKPRTIDDFWTITTSGWVSAFDNVTHLPAELMNAMCQVCTDGFYEKRKLYQDDEKICLIAKRPQLITSINNAVTASDLADRALIVEMPSIPESERIDRGQLALLLEQAKPQVLGALLNAAAVALSEQHAIKGPYCRLADFEKFATAGMDSLGYDPEAFRKQLRTNRNHAAINRVSNTPWLKRVCDVAEEGNIFENTVTEILDSIRFIASEDERHDRSWPKNERTLGRWLKNESPTLRRLGYSVENRYSGSGKNSRQVWSIRKSEVDPIKKADKPADDEIPF